MGFDWENVLDVDGEGVAETYDEAASDALYQDHPSARGATTRSWPSPDHFEDLHELEGQQPRHAATPGE